MPTLKALVAPMLAEAYAEQTALKQQEEGLIKDLENQLFKNNIEEEDSESFNIHADHRQKMNIDNYFGIEKRDLVKKKIHSISKDRPDTIGGDQMMKMKNQALASYIEKLEQKHDKVTNSRRIKN